jgi:polysaccharide export outer membrane protein
LRSRSHSPLNFFLALAVCSLLGCARQVVVRRTLPSAVISMDRDALDPAVLKQRLDPSITIGERDGVAYRVGPGDTMLVAVYGHPELSISAYGGSSAAGVNPRSSGLVVDNDGSVQFPLIGSVPVAGKDSGQLRVFLEQELGRYIKDPKVTVQVVGTHSIRYYLLGEFREPGLKYSDRPLNLLEAMALGGSVNLDKASLRSAYIARAGKRLPINVRKLFRDGDLQQNIRLRTGDVVVVPDNTAEQAFVFGGAGNQGGGPAKGGAVPFRNGRLDIMQALSQAGFGYRERAQGDFSSTRVIRSEGDRGELFVVDVERIMDGEAATFWLQPGDVVIVPQNGVVTWNLLMEQLLPTLQAVAGVLNPFVQIKYLRQ